MKKILLSLTFSVMALTALNAQNNGCLNAVNGQYPPQTFLPECTGIPENIVTTA